MGYEDIGNGEICIMGEEEGKEEYDGGDWIYGGFIDGEY